VVPVSVDLSYDNEQVTLQRSIDGFCHRCGTSPEFAQTDPLPVNFWLGLGDLGVLGLGTDIGGGGALEIAAAMETLGYHGAPGPLVGTFAATALLDTDRTDELVSGTTLASVGGHQLYPWAPKASVIIELDNEGAWLVEPDGDMEEYETTGGEPWGRGPVIRTKRLGFAELAVARAAVAAAAYVVGAAHALVELSTEYARNRVQFNKPIATFQAVSHPLAAAATRLNGSRILVRSAAQRLDRGADEALSSAAIAKLSAIASGTEAAYRAHQLFGAMGFTLEGPVAFRSHRIRQVGLLVPNQRQLRTVVAGGLNLSN